jgi:spore maturation protein CgeB
MRIAFFGSSLVSAYWNGAATYYRGILKYLHARGHEITFYEPDAFDRQKHRDLSEDPPYAKVVVYSGDDPEAPLRMLAAARGSDVVVKASGVGVFDQLLEKEVLALQESGSKVIFWDVDAPATLDRLAADSDDPFHQLVGSYDLVLTYGGGDPVVAAYERAGARRCVPIFNAFDPDTHHPTPPDLRYTGSLGLVANRLPDRESRVLDFFFGAAAALPDESFLLAGNGWEENAPDLSNVRKIGHLYTRDHNAFNCSCRAVLNIARDSMARYGFSPATRVFEAAGAGACLITDAWEGIGLFLEPSRECLVANNGAEVATAVASLTPERARAIGMAARARVLSEHTYAHRAKQLDRLLAELLSPAVA